MSDGRKGQPDTRKYLYEMIGCTLMLALGIWELTERAGGFGAWLVTLVATMGVVKAGWSLRAGDL